MSALAKMKASKSAMSARRLGARGLRRGRQICHRRILEGHQGVAGLKYEVIAKDSQSNPTAPRQSRIPDCQQSSASLMLVASTLEDDQSSGDDMRGGRAALACRRSRRGSCGSSASRASRPIRSHGWGRLNTPITSSGGLEGRHRRLHQHVGTDRNQQAAVGGMFPNDGDGNAWGDATVGFPPVLAKPRLPADRPRPLPEFRPMISRRRSTPSKRAGSEIVTGVMIPPDFTTFWNQAQQQGFRSKVASIGKAPLFPQSVEALGKNGNNLSTEVWWTPHHPFRVLAHSRRARRSLPKASARPMGRQWTQPIGVVHALFEVAVRTCSSCVDDPSNAQKMVAAAQATNVDTIVGYAQHPVERRQSAAVRGEEHLQDASRRRPVAAGERRRPRPCHRRQPDGCWRSRPAARWRRSLDLRRSWPLLKATGQAAVRTAEVETGG